MRSDDAAAAAALLALALVMQKKEDGKVPSEWYYMYKNSDAGDAFLEFPDGVWECSFADLMMRTQTAKGAYRAQIILYDDTKAGYDKAPTQLKEYFLESGYIAYGHHLVARNFMIKGPCILEGQALDMLGHTFTIKIAALVRKIA
jgi:hypothetical protein